MKESLMRPTDFYPIPGNVVHVAKTNGDFPSLLSAIEVAGDMNHSSDNRINIIVYPGEYEEDSDDPIDVPDYMDVEGRGGVTISRTGSGDVFTDDTCVTGITINDDNYSHENLFCNRSSKSVYNQTLGRREFWIRTEEDGEYILYDVNPGIRFEDNFISSNILAPTILGLQSTLMWAVNGRRGGAVAVNETCFGAANDIGGGLKMIVNSGGNDNDYTAMHFGDNYPLVMSRYPSICTTIDFTDDMDVAYIAGLVDDTRSTTTNAFALPDNGVYFYLDTDTGDAHVHCIVRIGGVDVGDQDIGPSPVGISCGCIRRNLKTGYIEFILNGQIVYTYTGAMITEQLQPYAVVVARAAGLAADISMQINRMVAVETTTC